MGTYRVELASTGRAGCKGTECKQQAIKIDKGEFRFGTLITIQEHTSWTWKHWGCVTPAQIENWKESIDGDLDLVDGFDEVPEEWQTKVKRALEQGHVDDEDWRGDVEVNRPGKKGFRVKKPKEKTPKKGKKADASDDEAEAEAPVQPAAKKRGRPAKKEESDDEAPPPKKSRGKAKKVKEEAAEDDGEQEAAPPAAKRGRPKKVKVELKDEDDEEVPVKPGFEKKSKSKKVKTEAKDEDNEEAPVKPVREKKKSKSKKVKPEPITMTQECLEDFTPNPWVETLLSDPIEASDEVMPVSEEPEVPIKTKRSRKKKGEDPSDAVEAAPDSSSKLKKGKAAKTDPEKPQKRGRKAKEAAAKD